MTFDPHKPARTRDGRPVKLVNITGSEVQPYVFSIPDAAGGSTAWRGWFNKAGQYLGQGVTSPLDLENYTPDPTPTFDPTKPVQTRDGRKARILCTDRRSEDYPILALLLVGDSEVPHAYTADGRMFKYPPVGYAGENDLINTPEEHTRWTVVWRSAAIGEDNLVYYMEEQEAQRAVSGMRARGTQVIAVLPFTYKEGQGLPPVDPK